MTKFTLSNGVTLELGPTLQNRVFWGDNKELEQLNLTLPKGEKLWRRPTKEEFEEIGKPIRDIQEDESLNPEQKAQKIKEYLEDLGFSQYRYYLSGTKVADSSDCAWGWYSGSGNTDMHYKDDIEYPVRVVR